MSIDGIHSKLPGMLVPFEVRSFQSQEMVGKREPVRKEQDSLVVSPANREFVQVREMVDATPDFRLEKVNQLAKQIEEGTYNVRGELIADALIRKNLIDFEV
jgi:flagellar biosynthesis anti-sigma factor FlgM